MSVAFTYRGKALGPEDIQFIRRFIAQNPGLSRRRLSVKLCQACNWVQANGHPRDMVCRGLLLGLHRAALIQLPPPRCRPPNPLAQRRPPRPVALPCPQPIQCSLEQLGPVQIQQVRRSPQEPLFGHLIHRFHYLGYTQPVGEHLKYLYWAGGAPIGCMAWSSAPRHLGVRDRFIGWSARQRQAHLHLLAYNSRFLLLPWVRVPQLASHLLARTARVISQDWNRLYGHPIHLLESFIDPERFGGHCYRAANWVYLGQTTGRGKDDQSRRPNRSLKQLWVYPLRRGFRLKLCQDHG